MAKVRIGGQWYDLAKMAKKITVWQYLELEEQTGITIDQLEGGLVSSAKWLASFAFLIRRHQGDDVTFEQAAKDLSPEDFDETPEKPAEDPTTALTDSVQGVEPLSDELSSGISESTSTTD